MKEKILSLLSGISPYVSGLSVIMSFVGLLFLMGVSVGVVGLYVISLTFLISALCKIAIIDEHNDKLKEALTNINDKDVMSKMPQAIRFVHFIMIVFYCALIATAGILGVQILLVLAAIIDTYAVTHHVMSLRDHGNKNQSQ